MSTKKQDKELLFPTTSIQLNFSLDCIFEKQQDKSMEYSLTHTNTTTLLIYSTMADAAAQNSLETIQSMSERTCLHITDTEWAEDSKLKWGRNPTTGRNNFEFWS